MYEQLFQPCESSSVQRAMISRLKLYRLKLRRNVEPLLYYVTCKLRNARKAFCKQARYNNSRVFKHVTLFPVLVS